MQKFMELRQKIPARNCSALQSEVKQRKFEVGNLVLREAEASNPQNTGKLMSDWEGLYEVIGVPKSGTYRLRTLEGIKIENMWLVGVLVELF